MAQVLADLALRTIDEAATSPLLVLGSIPPEGRDLDLLGRDEDARSVGAALQAAGAVRRDDSFAFFGDGTAYGVDVERVSAWGLRPDEVEALFGEATPLDGHPKLLRPSPHHALLVLARLGVTPKRRARFVDALAVPGARAEAERRAHLWGVTLDSVERRPPPRVLPPRVVALSGLDGSGKSTQTRALQSALEALGYRVHVEWAPILQNRSIETLSRLARVVLRRGAGHAVAGGRSIVAQADATTVSRRALRAGWTSLVALVNGWSHRRPVLAHRGSQTVVVYDRFVLDSTVRIRFLYGRDERFGPQRTLLRALSPRPVAAFWLDVPPERAYARKPEHWDVDDLTAQRELYAQEHAGFGVRRLDGELPPDELAAAIARDVWLAL